MDARSHRRRISIRRVSRRVSLRADDAACVTRGRDRARWGEGERRRAPPPATDVDRSTDRPARAFFSSRSARDNSALCLYIQVGDTPWEYCGCVANAKPSDVFALRWPVDDAGAPHPTAAVGVSIEPLASALEKESGLVRHKETFAKRVAEDLYVYMQSFQTDESASSDRMVVPVNILQKWFEKFTNRFRRDPGYLDRPRLDVA